MRSFKEMRRSGRSTFPFKFFVFSTVALTGFAHQASGVTGVTVSAEKAHAVITSDSEISGDAIESAVQAAGYSLVP